MNPNLHLIVRSLWILLCVLSASAGSADTNWWSLRPLHKPTAPVINHHSVWARTPIDHFVLAKLREQQLEPSAPADKQTLLRRVYFDLEGLPPTPEQSRAFQADT